jgi:type II secretory pathway pseudopilin PulG
MATCLTGESRFLTDNSLAASGSGKSAESLGFSMIELLVAVTLIMIGSLAALTMQRAAVKQNNLTDTRETAAWLARQLTEKARVMRYFDASLANTSPANTWVALPAAVSPANKLNALGQNSSTGIYTREWQIDNPTGTTNIKRIQVRVSWNESGDTERLILRAMLKAR